MLVGGFKKLYLYLDDELIADIVYDPEGIKN